MTAKSNKEEKFRSGYVSLTGRPNVGKSTLLNSILGEKISIVTSKPQTTRKRIIGIKTTADSQVIFIDSPGIHKPVCRLGEFMNKEAGDTIKEADLILFMVEPVPPGLGDIFIVNLLKEGVKNRPVFLLINKADALKKEEILPVIKAYSGLYDFDEVFPLSAIDREDVRALMDMVVKKLPHGPKYYPDDVLTDRHERFIVSEIIREKIMDNTRQEIPHSVAVEIVQWTERKDGLLSLYANIYVERSGQKGIIIGKGGDKLRMAGSSARSDIEKLLRRRVFLKLWVKVRKDWRSDDSFLKELGFR